VPSENAKKREASDHVPYPQWISEGLIKTTPGKTIDYEYIRKEINHLAKDYAIRHVFIDPWNATQLMLQLSQDGFEVVKFQQSHANYTGPTRELEKIIIAGMLEHGGNKVLRWNAQNTAIETNAMEQVRPSKRKSTERIDGIVATIIGIAGALSDKDAGPSIYETRGLIEV
jgi:phage terminase large subunit-like protein